MLQSISAYSELGDDETVPGATTIVVRTKRDGERGRTNQ